MAKHRRKWDETVFRQYIRKGRGQGVGAKYKPWITVQDFSSRGMVSRVKGQTTGRVHHLMSNYETSLFYLLDWSDTVTDIREQYPLIDLNKAVEIAEKANIRYPYDAKSGFPYVMTSDFVIETSNGIAAVAVKPTNELENLRVREKLEIERRYWASSSIRWSIVTEREINQTKARNIEWLSQARSLFDFGLCINTQIACIEFFISEYPKYKKKLNQLFTKIELKFRLSPGIGLNIYKHLAYRKFIDINIDQLIKLPL